MNNNFMYCLPKIKCHYYLLESQEMNNNFMYCLPTLYSDFKGLKCYRPTLEWNLMCIFNKILLWITFIAIIIL